MPRSCRGVWCHSVSAAISVDWWTERFLDCWIRFRAVGALCGVLLMFRIVVLEYNTDKNTFDRVHMETFGKSGCRRIVPGQYLACDPKGRAIMIGAFGSGALLTRCLPAISRPAAVEKQKLVYIMNRDAAAHLTISSPLEAHKVGRV